MVKARALSPYISVEMVRRHCLLKGWRAETSLITSLWLVFYDAENEEKGRCLIDEYDRISRHAMDNILNQPDKIQNGTHEPQES